MKKIHKQNYIILLSCIVILLILGIMKFGWNKEFISVASSCGVSAILITLCYFFVKNEYWKGIIIIWLGASAAITYSILVGGSSTAIYALFIFLGMATSYFIRKMIYITNL